MKFTEESLQDITRGKRGYTIDDNGFYNIQHWCGDIQLDDEFTSIGIKFGSVNNFFVGEGLSSLKNCPINVRDTFSLTCNNKIKSLKGCPQTVRNFTIHDCDNVNSLEFSPASCETLTIHRCKSITSLVGIPTATESIHINRCDFLVSILDKDVQKVLQQVEDLHIHGYFFFVCEQDMFNLKNMFQKPQFDAAIIQDYQPIINANAGDILMLLQDFMEHFNDNPTIKDSAKNLGMAQLSHKLEKNVDLIKFWNSSNKIPAVFYEKFHIFFSDALDMNKNKIASDTYIQSTWNKIQINNDPINTDDI